MMQTSLEQRLTELVLPLAEGFGLSLWGLEMALGPRGLLRIFVESDQGVDIEQCAELSRLISLTLDVEDLIPGAYVLEVSSPGLERRFFTEAQLAGAQGQLVDIVFHNPLPEHPGRRKYRGLLSAVPALPAAADAGAAEGLFSLEAEAADGSPDPVRVTFSFIQVKKAQLVHLPPEKPLPGKGPGKKSQGGKKKKSAPDAPPETTATSGDS